MIYTSSPPLDAVGGEPMFNLKDRGEAGTSRRLAWFDWGAESDVDQDDPHEWAKSNPALGVRITSEWVAGEQESMTPEGFGRERLGIWPNRNADSSIKAEDWSTIADPASRRAGPIAIAVDITPNRDAASIAIYGIRPDGLGHAEIIENRPGVRWIVPRLIELRDAHKVVAFTFDAAGPAGSLLIPMEKAEFVRCADEDEPKLGELAIPTTRQVTAACGDFIDSVKAEDFRHIDQPQFNTAALGAKTRPVGDAKAWARKTPATDISPLVAATLARWAYESRAHLITEKFNAWDYVH
jgi:hypothetical protein